MKQYYSMKNDVLQIEQQNFPSLINFFAHLLHENLEQFTHIGPVVVIDS